MYSIQLEHNIKDFQVDFIFADVHGARVSRPGEKKSEEKLICPWIFTLPPSDSEVTDTEWKPEDFNNENEPKTNLLKHLQIIYAVETFIHF